MESLQGRFSTYHCKINHESMSSVVHWPKEKNLCFPSFSDEGNQSITERKVEARTTSAKPQMTQTEEGSVSLSPLSSFSLSPDSEHEEEQLTARSPRQPEATQQHFAAAEEEREISGASGSASVRESADVLKELVDSWSPVREDLPRDRGGLQELRLQTELELVWLRQAISSRQKVCIPHQQMSCMHFSP